MRIQSFALSALLLSAALALPVSAASTSVSPAVPWQIALGPEKLRWIPEPVDESVSRFDLDASMKSAALAVDEAFIGESHDNLLGLAFHPEFGMGTTHDFVYVAFAYVNGPSGALKDRRARIVQYQWDAEAATLSDPVELFSGLQAP